LSAAARFSLRFSFSVFCGAFFASFLGFDAPFISASFDEQDRCQPTGFRITARYPPAMPSEKSEPLTSAQKEKLKAELAELEGPRRAEAVQAIAAARSFGDLSENFEYHAAKNEQGLLERRIALLRDKLDRAVLVDEDVASDVVGVGTRVEIEDERGERMQVEISSVGGVSPESPVGRALLGRKAGDDVDIEAPSGSWRARILSISR
jgi:transcription elongation factor GreA